MENESTKQARVFMADRLLVIGFVGALFLSAITFFVNPIHGFSELENRYLQSAPKLTWDNIISHKYADEAEAFVSDQFPFRKQWIWLKSLGEQLRGQRENNGIYKGKDGYLFEKFNEPDFTKLDKYIEAIKLFSEKHPSANVNFLLAPTSVGLYPERLPWQAPTYSQAGINQYVADRLQQELLFINGFDFLGKEKDEQIFYRTDHHWTTYGAYLAYVAFATEQGWKPLTLSDFEIKTVSQSFLGSYHTRGQYFNLIPDSIQAYYPRVSPKTDVFIADTNSKLASLYDESFLAKKDKYAYFLGGVHALMKLTTQLEEQAINQEKLLVIKDSYAHNVIPFLTLHVPEIHVLDIRFYNGSISNYMAEHNLEDVLILFNTATFVDNQALLKFKN